MAVDVFFSSAIQGNPYLGRFRMAAVVLCGIVAFMTFVAVMIRKRGATVASFMRRLTIGISTKLAHHVDQKIRAFGEGLNTVANGKALVKLIAISLLMWFMIALAYREVAHSYPPEYSAQEQGPPSVDVETARLADLPEMAGQPLAPDTIVSLSTALAPKGYKLQQVKGDLWLVKNKKLIKKIGDRPHLSNMDVSHVVLLMGFSMIGSVVQLPAVGGGSQLAVISALQVIYGIPPELAVSCGMLLWLVTFMACIPIGLILAHREHLSLRQLSAESHVEQPEPAETT
jgi:hypothetical protein